MLAECFPHPEGLLYFDLYWHLGQPAETTHVIKGEIQGEGPWKIDGHVINVLACHGTNHVLASQYQQWRDFLSTPQADYPPPPLVEAIARRLGAKI